MRAHVPLAALGLACLLALAALLHSPATHADEAWEYTVQRGENLWMLTERYLDSRARLAPLQRLNGIADPRRIPPGTRLRIPIEWMRASPSTARVTAVVGSVKMTAHGQSVARAAANADLVRGGDTIETAPGASAVLEFSDGSHVTLLSGTTVFLETLQQLGNGMLRVLMDLRQGRTEDDVTHGGGTQVRYRIRTPAGITSVRGTQLRVSVADATTARTEVLDGSVAVANAGSEVPVDAGFGVLVRAGEPPQQPVALLPAPSLAHLPAKVTQTPFELSFDALPGAASYRLQIASDERIVFDTAAPEPRFGVDALPDGRYVVRVRGIDAQGLEGRNATHAVEWAARPAAPASLSPADATVLIGSQPVFRWNAVAGANEMHYRLQISRDRDFSTTLVDATEVSQTTFSTAAPLTTGTWFWRVAAARSDLGAGPFSATQSVRIVDAPPTLQAPALSPTQVRITWHDGAADRRYRVQLARDDAFTAILQEREAAASPVTLPRPAPGRYWLRVLATEADGYPISPGAPLAFDAGAAPAAPEQIAPAADAEQVDGNVQFGWQAAPGAIRYRWQLAHDESFAQMLADVTTEQPNSRPGTPLPPGRYYWRVAGVSDIDGQGDFSTARRLRMLVPAPQVKSIAADGSQLRVDWHVQPAASAYELELARDAQFRDVIGRQSASTPAIRMPRPASGNYFIRIRSLDAANAAGPWSSPQTATVPARFPLWMLVPFLLILL